MQLEMEEFFQAFYKMFNPSKIVDDKYFIIYTQQAEEKLQTNDEKLNE